MTNDLSVRRACHAFGVTCPCHACFPNCVSLSRVRFCVPKLFTLALWCASDMVVFLLTVLVEGFAADQTSCLGPPHLLATFHGGSSSSDVNQVALRATLTLTHARLALILTAVLHATRLTGVRVHS